MQEVTSSTLVFSTILRYDPKGVLGHILNVFLRKTGPIHFVLPGLDYRNIGLNDRNVARDDRNSYLFSLTKMLSGRFFPKLSCRTSSPHSRPGQSAGSPKACLTTVSPRTAE